MIILIKTNNNNNKELNNIWFFREKNVLTLFIMTKKRGIYTNQG